MSAGVRRTFDSLSVPNYRRYFAGQVVSITGNWMQIIAEMWLIVQLTGSGVSVGLTAALQFLPMLLFGAWGGLLADRVPKLRLLQYTQALMALPALTLWALVASGHVTTLIVFALVLARGSVLAIDNPARQAFVMELVGHDRIVNAVALNSVVVHTSRIAGPALAGTVIALLGVGPCFALNALSFVAMLVVLHRLHPDELDDERLARRVVDREDRAADEHERVDHQRRDDVGGGQQPERDRRHDHQQLRDHQQPALVVAVGDDAAHRAEEEDRQELQPGGEADRRAAAGELHDEPHLGDRLHPVAGDRDDLAGEVPAVVRDAQ